MATFNDDVTVKGPLTAAVGGDLTGSLPSPTVSGIQGIPFSDQAPALDQIPQYNGSGWVPVAAPASGSYAQSYSFLACQTASNSWRSGGSVTLTGWDINPATAAGVYANGFSGASGGQFTIPSSGLYLVTWTIQTTNVCQSCLLVNESSVDVYGTGNYAIADGATTGSIPWQFTQGETVGLQITGSGAGSTVAGSSWFGATRLG